MSREVSTNKKFQVPAVFFFRITVTVVTVERFYTATLENDDINVYFDDDKQDETRVGKHDDLMGL